MRSKSATLSLIRARFPGRERLIERAFDESRSFRELCVDYRRCASAVDRWHRQNGIAASSRHREYTALLEELSLEIQDWLDAAKSVSTQAKNRKPL